MRKDVLSKQQSVRPTRAASSEAAVELAHPQVVAQRRLQAAMDGRPAVRQLARLGGMLDAGRAATAPIQRAIDTETGLPEQLKSGMEQLSGVNLDSVKVHYDSPKPATMQAHAFAQDKEIFVGPRQEQHLPHELGHVVQQMDGRVRPTGEIDGVAVNDDPSLEDEATRMGQQALRQPASSEG